MLASRKAVVAILALVIAVPAAYYLISPVFVSNTVREGPPSGSQSGVVVKMGTFRDADGFHKASGIAKLVRMADGSYVVRIEDFKVTNGPDLYLYLAQGKDASAGFLDLGRLKGNIGSQNYEIPAGMNPERYSYVLIWCRAFSVLFGYAELT